MIAYSFFPAAGARSFGDSIIVGRNGRGWYWSSNTNNIAMKCSYHFHNSAVYFNDSYPTNGFSVRCVAREVKKLLLFLLFFVSLVVLLGK